ncbi:MAG TPA: SoxR reducing system RseC family protein [Acetobacterium sp.]
MKEIGIIIDTKAKTARVAIQRHSACGDCGACHMSKQKSTMEAIALNPIDAKTGETVEVEMQFASVFKAASIMYGIPLVAFLFGSCFSYFLILNLGLNWDQSLVPFFSGIACLAVAYGFIKYCDKKGVFNSKYQPVIIAIVEKKEVEKGPMEKIMG